jgi:hypothetical protein
MATQPQQFDQALPVVIAPEPWSDENALKIVKADYQYASTDKVKNVDPKIQDADELYESNPKQRFWDTTKIKRAAVNIHLVYEQVNAIVPQIIQGLFADPSNFDVEPRPGTTFSQCTSVKSLLQFQLDDLSTESFEGLREIILSQLMDACTYGNGVIEFGFEIKKIKKLIYERQAQPPTVINGVTVAPGTSVITSKEVEEEVGVPYVRNVDIKTFFIDPNATSHIVQKAAYAGTDDYITIDALEEYRETDGFNIPSRDELVKLAKEKTASSGDRDTQFQDSLSGVSSNPQVDQSSDPAKARLRIIRYTQKGRCVWVLKGNEYKVIYNQPNKYGCINFLNICYSPRRNRFWGKSMAELLKSDQIVIEDLINNRLDQENLSMFPPVRKKRGVQMPQSAFRIAPGRVWEGDDGDFGTVEMKEPNAITFEEVSQVYSRVEKKLGASSLAVLGTGSPGGNSANRTARGVAVQSAATGVRMTTLVENCEGQVLVPLYNAILAMDQKFLDPAKMLQLMGGDEPTEIDPIDILNASVKFRLKAASKMRAKSSIAAGLPMLLEMGLNPALLDMLAKQQGMTADVKQWMELMCDVMDVPFRNLYRKLTPQEMQAMNQPDPDQALRKQMQDDRLAHQSETQSAKDDAMLTNTVATKLLGQPEVVEAITGVKLKDKKETSGKPGAGRKPTAK